MKIIYDTCPECGGSGEINNELQYSNTMVKCDNCTSGKVGYLETESVIVASMFLGEHLSNHHIDGSWSRPREFTRYELQSNPTKNYPVRIPLPLVAEKIRYVEGEAWCDVNISEVDGMIWIDNYSLPYGSDGNKYHKNLAIICDNAEEARKLIEACKPFLNSV